MMAAAAAVAMLIAGTQYVRLWRFDHVGGKAIRHEMLPDGTAIAMGPDTAFDSMFEAGARRIGLVRGEVFFKVHPDPAHPFVITAGNGVVRVLGTAFAVRRYDDDRVVVTVAHGRVEVVSGARRAVLTADRQIGFGPTGLGPVRTVESGLATAWIRGRLIMEDRPLSEVVAELNRYRGGRIVLLNAEAGRRRVNAVVDLYHIDNWLTALSASQGLELDNLGPVTLLR